MANLFGLLLQFFNPSRQDFSYKPLSQSIETDVGKKQKFQNYDMMMSRLAQIQHPDMVNIMNRIITKQFEILGDEYSEFSKDLLNPQQPIQPPNAPPPEAGGGVPTSNQQGIPQSANETQAREGAPSG